MQTHVLMVRALEGDDFNGIILLLNFPLKIYSRREYLTLTTECLRFLNLPIKKSVQF